MVKVSIEVRSGAARFRVAVQAESVQRAVSIAGGRYPGRDVRVTIPIDLEGSSVEASAARMVESERLEKLAA